MSMYSFDQPMRYTYTQAASALRKVVFELPDVTFYGCLHSVDSRCHRGQQKWA
jgi:hypothetical protein